MTRRLAVIGADAAGMSAALLALRRAEQGGEAVEVIALERTDYTSYSACGLPYWVSGEVDSYDDLVARSPEQLRKLGIDLRTGTEATHVDIDSASITARTRSGEESVIRFDDLLIASGARPRIPDWAKNAGGELIGGIRPVKNADDAAYWLQALARSSDQPVVIVGGGFIGLEMAEAVLERGHRAVLIEQFRVMSSLDPEMSDRIEAALASAGVEVITGDAIESVVRGDDGTVSAICTAAGVEVACRLVVLATGVAPVVDFVDPGTLPQGPTGGLRPDPRGELVSHVWAAGDCCEVRHRITGDWVYLPLGTHANKMGKAVGTNLAGGNAEFAGVLGTAITRFAWADGVVEIGRTGLSVREATARGYDPIALTTDGRTASGYMSEARPMSTLIIADRCTRALLGGQIVGGERAAKRIDTIAAALWGGLRVDDLAGMDLSYAPPFATVWEAVQLAARRTADSIVRTPVGTS